MKIALLALILIPFLSFGQDVQDDYKLSKKDKKNIDQHTLSMCNCLTEQVNSIHPKTVEILILVSEKGEEEGMNEIEAMMEEMEPEEMQAFIESFSVLESDEFDEKIDKCDHISELKTELQDQINNEQGVAYNYFMGVLNDEEECKFLKYMYELGSEE